MRDINLLQGIRNDKRQFDVSVNSRRTGVALFVLILLIAAAYVGTRYMNDQYTQQTDAARQEAKLYAEAQELKNAAGEKNAQLSELNELISTAGSSSCVNTELFSVLSGALGEGMFLTSISVEESGQISLAGKAETREDIVNLIYAMKKTDLFRDVYATILNTEKSKTEDAAGSFNFTMTAKVERSAEGE